MRDVRKYIEDNAKTECTAAMTPYGHTTIMCACVFGVSGVVDLGATAAEAASRLGAGLVLRSLNLRV